MAFNEPNEPMEPMQARAVALASRPAMTLGRRWQDLVPDEEPQLADYFAVIRRQARMIIGLVVVAGALAAAYLALATPKYRASVTLLIEPQLPKVLSIQDLKATAALADFYNTQEDIIRSRSVAEAVIGKVGPDKVRQLLVPPVWQRWWPERWRQSPGSDAEKDETEARLKAFRRALTVEGLKDSEIVTVGFDAVDPELAAEIANQVAGAYIDLERNARSSLSREANQWLAVQVEELRQKLAQSEVAVHQFQVREGLLDSQSLQTTNREKLSAVARDLIEAQSKRALAEVRYQQAREIETRSGGYESLLGVIENAAVFALKIEEAKLAGTVQELSAQHGENSPRLIAAKADLAENTRRLKAEIAVAVEAIRKEYEAILSHEQQLKKLSGTLKSSLQRLTTKEYELAKLEREAAINRKLFDMFLSRMKEIGVTSEFNSTNIRIVDRAVPPREPYSPNPMWVFALAGLLSVSLGIVLAFLREHLDRGFKTPRDIAERLKMPALGLLPRVDTPRSPAERQVILEPGSGFSEVIGDIRARLQCSAVQHTPKVVLITSSVRGEGKTTLASNLALLFSRSCRTLLVDADWRKAPEDTSQRGASVKGFSNFATGQSPLEECIVRDKESNNLYVMTTGDLKVNPLDFLSSDIISTDIGKLVDECAARDIETQNLYVTTTRHLKVNPLEVLSSDIISTALAKLRAAFDRIIIDGPPALAFSDAILLGRRVDGVILVVKAGDTPYPTAQEAVQKLRATGGIELLGAVLSQVDIEKMVRYGGHGYHYGCSSSLKAGHSR